MTTSKFNLNFNKQKEVDMLSNEYKAVRESVSKKNEDNLESSTIKAASFSDFEALKALKYRDKIVIGDDKYVVYDAASGGNNKKFTLVNLKGFVVGYLYLHFDDKTSVFERR